MAYIVMAPTRGFQRCAAHATHAFAHCLHILETKKVVDMYKKGVIERVWTLFMLPIKFWGFFPTEEAIINEMVSQGLH